jgi:transcriptional regulator with XRE-family HTH domain
MSIHDLIQPKLGQHLAECRRARGMTCAELARRIGVSPYVVWRIERGRTKRIPRGRLTDIEYVLTNEPVMEEVDRCEQS